MRYVIFAERAGLKFTGLQPCAVGGFSCDGRLLD